MGTGHPVGQHQARVGLRGARRLAGGLVVAATLGLVACASAPPIAVAPEAVLRPDRFAPPAERVGTDDLFALSDEMRRFLAVDMADLVRTRGPMQGLVDALYQRGRLKLEYDAARTKNAADAFATRSGNCLSLVVMTAAFAKALDLPVRYQSAIVEELWSRSGTLLFASGHVNVTFSRRLVDLASPQQQRSLTIDFAPIEGLSRLPTREIGERTVVAMYANNRAAEAMAAGRLDDAYAWTAEALRHDPQLRIAWNTLGVVYLRHGDVADAATVFERLLDADARDRQALANLGEAYARLGRDGDAARVRTRLAALEPEPPFHFFQQGIAAADVGDWPQARGLFAREVARAGYNPEFHFWLAVAEAHLGHERQAEEHLKLAIDNSTTRDQQTVYAAKLNWLQSRRLQ